MRKRSIGRLPRSEQGRNTVTKAGGSRHARLRTGTCSRMYSQTHTRAPLCELKLDPSREATKKNKKRKEREDATKSCNGERDACTLCEFEMLFFPLALTPCITRAERKKSNRFLRLPLTFQCSPILLRTAPGKRSEQNCR